MPSHTPGKFEFRELYENDEAFEAGEREGRRYALEGHDVRPWKLPVSATLETDFTEGFRYGVIAEELIRRQLPYDLNSIDALSKEWTDEHTAELQARRQVHRSSPRALLRIENEFDPLAEFAGPPKEAKYLDLCAGPGGWDEGGRVLGISDRIYGIDSDRDACNTARAAGFRRHQADITSFDPRDFTAATGLLISSPCPPFSRGSKTNVNHERDVNAVLDAISGLGDSEGRYTDPAELRDQVSDPRTALAYEIARWGLLAQNLDFIVAENVPGITPLYEDLAGEMDSFGWHQFHWATIDSETVGAASKRRRSFFVARKGYGPGVQLDESGLELGGNKMSTVLGWPEGERINTRGQRRTSGGNEFSADQVAWCLTEQARSWTRVSDGRPLTSAEAGLLNGFSPDYPWRGSRSKQFQQIADVVNPLIGAAILGEALQLPWREAVLARVEQLYGLEAAQTVAVEAPTVDPARPHRSRAPQHEVTMKMTLF